MNKVDPARCDRLDASVRMQDAAPKSDPLPAHTVLRIKKECDALGLDIVAFAWRIQEAAWHQCLAMLDKAQTEAYAEGRDDEREERGQ